MAWFRPRQLALAIWRDHRIIAVAVALSLLQADRTKGGTVAGMAVTAETGTR